MGDMITVSKYLQKQEKFDNRGLFRAGEKDITRASGC